MHKQTEMNSFCTTLMFFFKKKKENCNLLIRDTASDIMTCVISASRFAFSISKPTKLCSCSNPRVSSFRSLRSWNRISNPFSSASMSESAETNSLPPSDDGGVKAEETADVLIQYVVLRRDLIDSWPLGSVVTQGCHASVSAIWLNKDDTHTSDYCSPHNIDSMHKASRILNSISKLYFLVKRLELE